ncbi:CehA/McbA family metallohydrolase [Sphingobium ummariense]|uniref:Phosphotransferase n=1 Tax=Sphingobium ummariense RL-3 TaxID=1346791 RepID=T0KL54_9SPHN|nr:CehA/McbA family metallohydrolase [Sphingobium ummariense]EQB34108.1 hypothetical protein M529_00395 [Sphingobium ummariense RL-3]
MRRIGLLAAVVAACLSVPALAEEPDRTVSGEIVGADNQSYKAIPFDVPEGVERITVRLTYDRQNKTVIDLGVFDPQRFRGWSGGTRDRFTLSESDASPGYLPGALPAGRWHVQFGVPNARPDSRSAYRLDIFFDRGEARNATAAIADPPVKAAPGWYRGDLHMHDAHSDGGCASQSGKRVPCPLYRTVEAAAGRGLDFIAVTDHNTVSHFGGLRELQPAFDRMLLIPGTEITTFHGHANIFGPARWVDFRVGTPGVPTIGAVEAAVQKAGAILSINHPSHPSGEICMGCGWTWPDTDWSKVSAIEVVNGFNAEGPLSGLGYWYARLNEGKRLAGIGGSDNHDATAGPDKAPIGRPTTVVHARELSQAGIVDGIRAGNVFIDVEGTRDRLLEVTASSDKATAAMGESLRAAGVVRVQARVQGVTAGTLRLIVRGEERERRELGSGEAEFALPRGTACGWISVNVGSSEGRLLLIGNPVYVTCK